MAKPISEKVDNKRVQEILRQARDLMNHGGRHWIKRVLRKKINGEMCYCSLGSINAVTKSTHERRAAKKALLTLGLDKTYLNIDATERQIFRWNDNYWTEWKDVRSAFTRAARRLG